LSSSCKSVIARAIGISHYHLNRISKQSVKDKNLKQEIEKTWDDHPAYGQLRLSIHLDINKKRISRVMKKFGMKPPRRKASHFCTKSTSHHTYTNLIKDLVPTRANHIWVSDVSYFRFLGKWWYVATIEDLYTRQILGVQVSRHHDRWLVLSVSKQAVINAGCIPDIFHSDQGTEFMAKACTCYWEEQKVAISVSDKASPWQNGYKESFYSHFKQEFGRVDRFDNPGEFIAAIYSQVKYYNQDRIHTALKMSPNEYATFVSENPRHVSGT
jgi:transposase InsO family protein